MDRCALFVDAGYVLTDGAMAARGTNQREAVAWDYAGLLQFFAGLAVDRTGLPLLRCYWYEATVDGRRTTEHDTLADLPGLALRLGRMRPGKREGVDTEIHRDLTTLARNRAVSDVVLVSAEDDLAQVIADVQDLGVRVIIVHISVDGNWTVSRALRQQCDAIVEIQGTQLRPFAEPAGGEPARYSEQYAASVYGGRSMSNGHAATVVGGGHLAMPTGSTGAHPAPPAIYTAPVVAEYQQPPAPPAPPRPEPQQPEPSPAMDGDPQARGVRDSGAAAAAASQPNQAIIGPPSQPQPPQIQAQPPQVQGLHSQAQHSQAQHSQAQHSQAQHGQSQQSQPQPLQQLYAAPPAPSAPPAAAPAPIQAPPQTPSPAAFREPPAPTQQPAAPEPPVTQAPPSALPSAPPVATPAPFNGAQDQRPPSHRSPYEGPTSTSSFMESPGTQFSPTPPAAPPQAQPGTQAHTPAPVPSSSPADQFGSAPTSLPARHGPQGQGPPAQHGPPPARPQQQGSRVQQAQRQVPPAAASYVPPQAQYGATSVAAPSAPLLAAPPQTAPPQAAPPQAASPQAAPLPAPQPPAQTSVQAPPQAPAPAASSADEAVTAAHAEGFDFGESVARDAPALWLEAVLARKPRMPTDLEARLLQGSALPIDSLLHDEVRHALRRGFWDALERSRR